MKAVVDASLLVQAVVEEEFTRVAHKLLAELEEVVVPPLALYEAGNALVVLSRRRLLDEREVQERFSLLASLPNLEVADVPAAKAVSLAVSLGLTVYDAAYLALASELGLPLYTADRELAEKGSGAALVRHASSVRL